VRVRVRVRVCVCVCVCVCVRACAYDLITLSILSDLLTGFSVSGNPSLHPMPHIALFCACVIVSSS